VRVGVTPKREMLEELWGGKLDPNPGLTVVEVMDAIHAGVVKGMYIQGENPAMSDPDVGHAREALAMLEHLVVQDIFLTETAMYADVILPATAWPEKDGTVSNTNRQVQMGRQAIEAPGDARPDWWIIIEIAKRMGLPWTYRHPSEVFAEMKLAMPSLDNISWERLDRESSVTYPCPAPDQPGSEIVFGDRFPTESGLGKMVPAAVLPPDERPDREFPFVLSTGRQLEHWHTGAMTRRASVLDAVEPEPTVQMNPLDIARFGLSPGDMVRVASRRGTIDIKVRAEGGVAQGVVFIPFAYVEAAANLLTNPKLDPFGKIPEFKYCAVKVEALGEPGRQAAE
jgi:formate dehydrogenase major subunit